MCARVCVCKSGKNRENFFDAVQAEFAMCMCVVEYAKYVCIYVE